VATSGTVNFNLSNDDLFEHAFREAGMNMMTGQDLRDARRALNLLLAEWGNRGLNLWTIKSHTINLTAGVNTYNLPADCIDVIDHVIRTNPGSEDQYDRQVGRISQSTYAKLSNKLARQLPTQCYVGRTISPTITVYPTPDQNYEMPIWYLRRLEDTTYSHNTTDAPVRFLPALVAGLAYRLAKMRPSFPMDRIAMLKQDYEEQFGMAADEDRDRAKGLCDRCGFTYLLSELREETRRRVKLGNLVCADCFDEDHPQNFVDELVITDSESLETPRPDKAYVNNERVVYNLDPDDVSPR